MFTCFENDYCLGKLWKTWLSDMLKRQLSCTAFWQSEINGKFKENWLGCIEVSDSFLATSIS